MVPLNLGIQHINDHDAVTDMSEQTHEDTSHNASDGGENHSGIDGLVHLVVRSFSD